MRAEVDKSQGFTIVEVAVAISVIAILASMVVFSFNAAVDNAHTTTLKANLTESSSSLKKEKADNGSYPQTQGAAAEFMSASDGVNLQYHYMSSSAGYCLEGTIEDMTYHITPNRTEAVEGSC